MRPPITKDVAEFDDTTEQSTRTLRSDVPCLIGLRYDRCKRLGVSGRCVSACFPPASASTE